MSDDYKGIGHIAPLRILIVTGVGLLFLTWVTVAVAQFDLGEANIFIALGVATLKATLVGLFFMHLRWDRPFNGFILLGSLAFVMLFIAFAMLDSAEYQDELKPGDAPAVLQAIEDAAPES